MQLGVFSSTWQAAQWGSILGGRDGDVWWSPVKAHWPSSQHVVWQLGHKTPTIYMFIFLWPKAGGILYTLVLPAICCWEILRGSRSVIPSVSSRITQMVLYGHLQMLLQGNSVFKVSAEGMWTWAAPLIYISQLISKITLIGEELRRLLHCSMK